MTTALKIIALLRARLARLLRYAAVSAISTATSLTVLGLLVGLANAPAGWSNVAPIRTVSRKPPHQYPAARQQFGDL